MLLLCLLQDSQKYFFVRQVSALSQWRQSHGGSVSQLGLAYLAFISLSSWCNARSKGEKNLGAFRQINELVIAKAMWVIRAKEIWHLIIVWVSIRSGSFGSKHAAMIALRGG